MCAIVARLAVRQPGARTGSRALGQTGGGCKAWRDTAFLRRLAVRQRGARTGEWRLPRGNRDIGGGRGSCGDTNEVRIIIFHEGPPDRCEKGLVDLALDQRPQAVRACGRFFEAPCPALHGPPRPARTPRGAGSPTQLSRPVGDLNDPNPPKEFQRPRGVTADTIKPVQAHGDPTRPDGLDEGRGRAAPAVESCGANTEG